MATGINTTNLANKILDHLRGGTAWTQPAGLYVKLHTGDPGSAGTANASAVTTRSQATFGAASSGAIALTGTNPSWSMTATETITHISVWDASTAGNFLWSAALSASKSVVNGDTLTQTSLGFAQAPLAA
ncbi:phage tail fiber protein (plasmid) [Nocardia sp. CA-151230]|uniref:phage tail fiber protein n=1 Tax=Nocardia sp. CA-151230 TaxID=3239982 RepID=UPI003D8AD658